MKKGLKILGITLLVLILIALITGFVKYRMLASAAEKRYGNLGESSPILTQDGFSFRDLNKNGKLDVYEDRRANVESRVRDLVSQMSLEEKAGTMYITMIGISPDAEPVDKPFIPKSPMDFMAITMLPQSSEMLIDKKMNSFNIIHS